MSALEKPRIPRDEALAIAYELVDLIKRDCERIQIAGSLRRGKETVGDIELVAIPRISRRPTDLFGTVFDETDCLHETLSAMRGQGTIEDRLDTNGRPAWGKKLKRMRFRGYPVDLFCAVPENWGLILLIRTGPGDFNQRWVTQRLDGGTILPFGMRVAGGWLWRGSERLDTPDEESVFRAIGLGYIDPVDRT